ncbi:hypothetical protein [Nocardioides sp. 1609]|uniref:hypothetical protein n=1 Tax=Nocardioides sp. 1609 TaxID=2508327 RepID=UPI0010703350|nr:hypothetical protein [Nocardioides sp. 1609]
MSSLTIPIILISLLIPVVAFVVILRSAGSMGPRSKILRSGLPGEATVLAIAPTGTIVNGVNYMCRLQLRVSVANRQPYDVEIKELLPITAMAVYPAGARVAVKVDPTKPERVVLDRAVAPVHPAAGAYAAPPTRPAL